MTEAYKCDRCNSLAEGKPFGIVRLVSEEGQNNAEVCEGCYRIIFEQIDN
jgi:hypothetical protein